MKLTLPKSLYRYLTPENREQEIYLAIVWRGYLQRRKELKDDEEGLDHLNASVLSGVFNVPRGDWARFLPSPGNPFKALAKQMQALAQSAQRKQSHQKSRSKRKKKKKKPVADSKIIVRRVSRADENGSYPIDHIKRSANK